MKPISLLSLAISLLMCMSSNAQTYQDNRISAIQAINVWPISFDGDTNDTLIYFFRHDTVLLRTSYTFRHTFFSADREDEDSSITSKHYRYFLYKKGETTGKWFEDYQPSPNKFNETVIVDSVLQHLQGYFTTPLSTLLAQDSMTLISSRIKGQDIERTYIFNKHIHLKGPDTLILGFSPTLRHPDFLFYNYKPEEDHQGLCSVKMIVQCDEAIQRNMPEFALIKIHHYLSEVSPEAIAEAEKYFALFNSPQPSLPRRE